MCGSALSAPNQQTISFCWDSTFYTISQRRIFARRCKIYMNQSVLPWYLLKFSTKCIKNHQNPISIDDFCTVLHIWICKECQITLFAGKKVYLPSHILMFLAPSKVRRYCCILAKDSSLIIIVNKLYVWNIEFGEVFISRDSYETIRGCHHHQQ